MAYASEGLFFLRDRKPEGRQQHWFSDSVIQGTVFWQIFWPFPEGHDIAGCLHPMHHFLVQAGGCPGVPQEVSAYIRPELCHTDARKVQEGASLVAQ